jgi:hypothetical protein
MTLVGRYRAGHIPTWAVTLWVLGLIDWTLTHIIISNGGHEVNPMLAGWIGTWWGLAVKAGVTGLLLIFLVRNQEKRLVREGIFFVTFFYILVVLWNVSTLFTQLTRMAL